MDGFFDLWHIVIVDLTAKHAKIFLKECRVRKARINIALRTLRLFGKAIKISLRSLRLKMKESSSFLISQSNFKILEFNQLKIYRFLFLKTLAESNFCCIFALTITQLVW